MSTNLGVARTDGGVHWRGGENAACQSAFDLLQFAVDLLRDAPASTSGVPRLLWRGSDGTVRALLVTRPLTMGSDPGCDVVLSCPGVSPMHCLLGPSGTFYEIVDLGSAGGTFVNVSRIGRTLSPLADGDLIRIGTATALFAR
jgi:hypothetical protein